MSANWTTVHPNPDAISLVGSFPGEEEAVAYRGLELVPLYDYEDQMVWYDSWELRLAKTGEPLLQIVARGKGAALEWATRIAEAADWASYEELPSWYGLEFNEDLRSLILKNPDVLCEPLDPANMIEDAAQPLDADDLDTLVPFG